VLAPIGYVGVIFPVAKGPDGLAICWLASHPPPTSLVWAAAWPFKPTFHDPRLSVFAAESLGKPVMSVGRTDALDAEASCFRGGQSFVKSLQKEKDPG
jgi:hypothetical protein